VESNQLTMQLIACATSVKLSALPVSNLWLSLSTEILSEKRYSSYPSKNSGRS